jgi:hypothetical protein
MNALTTLAPGGIPAVFQSRANLPDMNKAASANLLPSFAVMSIKGKNWRIKYKGEEELVADDRGIPMQVLPVVIVGISEAISKIWYEKGWSESSKEAPDCFSVDGKVPDPAAARKQNATCATCPKNIFGSRITENGKKGKACSDTRRIAIVPHGDLENESYGGPMMLRLPAMSLPNLDAYARSIARFGAQPYMVVTNLRFNYDVSHPEVIFETGGWLSNEDAAQVIDMLDDPRIDRILSTPTDEVIADAAPDPDAAALAGGPPPAVARHVAPQPAPAPAPAPAPTPVAATPAKRGFGKKSVEAAQPAPVAAAPAPTPTTPPATTTVVTAPDSMEAAIDDLLA